MGEDPNITRLKIKAAVMDALAGFLFKLITRSPNAPADSGFKIIEGFRGTLDANTPKYASSIDVDNHVNQYLDEFLQKYGQDHPE